MSITSFDEQVIIAQCTPRGPGALALVRLSGINAFTIADNFSQLIGKKKLSTVDTHTVHYGTLVDENGKTIDIALFIVMQAPHTFTGQNTLEITCHNNQYIIDHIISRAVQCGARLAHGGEFSKRAYLNDKIDLMQAEAIHELIMASSQAAVKKSLEQLSGSFSAWICTIEKQLLQCVALTEASFEFIDEEITFQQEVIAIIEKILVQIIRLKAVFDNQKHLREGIRIALIGSVNAGKSSLFNALLQKERAIVTPHPGTTRDAIEATIMLNDMPCTLIDTAGFRHTNDTIERIGIEKAYAEAEHADIVIIVFDASAQWTADEATVYYSLMHTYKDKCIIVANKIDDRITNYPHIQFNIIDISCIRNKGIAALLSAIQKKIVSLFATGDSPFLVNERHYHVLVRVERLVYEIKGMLMQDPAYELISCHIRDALVSLTELTGKTISEKGLNAVFREFCVGK